MDEGLDPPCLELGDDPEHRLLAWLTRKANKRTGVVPYEYERLIERAAKGVFGSAHRVRPTEQAIRHLFDGDYLQKVDFGASFGFKVLVRCFCAEKIPLSPPQAVRRSIVMPEGHGDGPGPSVACSGFVCSGLSDVLTGVKSESVQKSDTTFSLARDFFPQVVEQAGIQMNPLQANFPALASHLNRWKAQGVDLSTMRLMMEEFVNHPDWCHRSNRSPWRVFISRREELVSIVLQRQQRDPAARRFSDNPIGQGSYWNRHTPRAYSPA
jgi:hypothetical protein